MTADMIIKGNAIFDSVSDKPFAGFVAVKGNRIAAVGKENGQHQSVRGR